MGVLTSIEGSNPSFSAWRGGRAVECGGLENRFGPLGPTRVQIPPPPLDSADTQAAQTWVRPQHGASCRDRRGFRAQAPDLAQDAILGGWPLDPLPNALAALQQGDPAT